MRADQVPDETGLKNVNFTTNPDRFGFSGSPYISPQSWSNPSPISGPHTVMLNDGSTVTYSWYRFIDQPSLQGFGWSDAEKKRLQKVVENIHSSWNSQTEFIAPPTVGDLATLDAALVVVPPKGMEIGYVPIVIRQAN